MRAASVTVAVALATAILSSPLEGEACPELPAFYEQNKYVVRQVHIDTPLSFLGSVRRQFLPVQRSLPLQPGSLFRGESFSRSFARVRDAYAESNIAAGERIRLSVVLPDLENCDSSTSPPQLDVVFRVYATETIFALARVFEGRPDRITRALAPGALASSAGKLLPQPFIGFNPNRGLFGGTAASFEQDGKLIQRVDVSTAVGNGNLATELTFNGTHTFDRGFLSVAEWKFGHRYSDLPAGTPRLRAGDPESSLVSVRSGIGFGQFSAASNPFGRLGVVMRFGGALEGGNRSIEGNVAPEELAAARHGALKTFAGATFNAGRQAFSASYGVQFGSAGRDIGLDYLKHVGDIGHAGRILLREHFALRTDTRFTAGAITRSGGPLPVAERFRGGNVARDFIEGDGWRIRSAPLIRSFPENTLLRTSDGALGGTNFFSLNFTLGVPVFSYPAIPVDIGREPDIRIALSGALATAKQGTILSYLNETPEFATLSSAIAEIRIDLMAIAAAAPETLGGMLSGPLRQRIGDFAAGEDDEDQLHDAIATAEAAEKNFGRVRTLVIGFTEPAQPATLEDIEQELGGIADDLDAEGLKSEASKYRDFRSRLEARRKAAVPLYHVVRDLADFKPGTLDESKAVLPAIKQSVADIDTVLDSLGSRLTDSAARVRRYTQAVRNAVNSVEDPESQQSAISDLDRLARGTGEMTEPLLVATHREILALARELASDAGASSKLTTAAASLEDARQKLQIRLAQVVRPDVERKALRDVAYTGRVLDVVFREMSLFSISPVFLFDAARIGPQRTAELGGVRYGIGGGIRLSVVSLDVTVGYSRNPSPRPWEPRGALFFSLDVADLFR